MSLQNDLIEAEARVARLRKQIAQGPCIETGHSWQHIGGRNAGCDDLCSCSIPVYQCAKCGDCDYGDNAEATEIRADCAAA